MDVIPLIKYPNQELQIILDDQDCTIRVTERSRYTFLDLTVGNTPVRKGMICTESARFLKYFTPFSYCDGADIIADKSLDLGLIAIGAAARLAGVAAAWFQYDRKDIS